MTNTTFPLKDVKVQDIPNYDQYEKKYISFLADLNSPSIISQKIMEARNKIQLGSTNSNDLSRIEELEKTVKKLSLKIEDLSKIVAKMGGTKGDSKQDDDDSDDLFGEKDDAPKSSVKSLIKTSAKKPLIAKSTILLDIKPWSDETDMKKMEECVRTIACDGLLWGQSKFVDVAYGLKKLVIGCVVEDDKVGTDFLEESILKFEDYVQSVDIAAFNKL